MKFPNKDITHGFPKDWWIVVQSLRLIAHFWKSFWSIKKIPCISPLFHNNTFISNFREKGELFNTFFAQQCNLISNASKIYARLNIKTTKTLSSIPVTRADIAKIIKNFDPNKAHGHDMISIRMPKLCCESVLPLLELIFKSCVKWYVSFRMEKSKCSSGA